MTRDDAEKIALHLARESFPGNKESVWLSLRIRYGPDDTETLPILLGQATPYGPLPADSADLDPMTVRILKELEFRSPHEQAAYEREYYNLSNDWVTKWKVTVEFEKDLIRVPEPMLGLAEKCKVVDGFWGVEILVDGATGAAEVVEIIPTVTWQKESGPPNH